MSTSDDSRTLQFPTLALAWVYFAGYAAWAAAVLAGLAPRGVVNDVLFLPLYLGCAWSGFRTATYWAPEAQRASGWRFVGTAWLLSAAGSVLWLLNRLWPSPVLDWTGWVLYNLYYPFTLLGLWCFFEMPREGRGRFRIGLEILTAVVATAILAWYLVFRFDEATSAPLQFVKAVSTLFLGELLIVAGASAVLHCPAFKADIRSLVALGIGSFSAAIADFAYEQNRLLGSVWSGPTGDLLLALGATLIFSAGVMSRGRARGDNAALPAVSVGLILLPYVAVGVVAGLLVYESIHANLGSGPIAGLIIGGAMLLVLVIARLLVAQREFAAEAAARAAQDARFRSLVQRSTDAILVVTADGSLLSASPAFGRMVGLPESDLSARSLPEFVHPDQRGGVVAWLRSPGNTPHANWRVGRDGSWRNVEAVATDLTSDPAVAGIVVNVRCVTERVRLEAELQQAQKMEVVGRLSSSIAHDFNNLLTVILGNVSLARSASQPSVDADLAAAEGAARRGATLARQLLSLSRMTSPSPRTTDLGRLIRGLEGTLRSALPTSMDVHVETGPEPLPVAVDEVQIEQILLNLAINARDALASTGALRVRVDRAGAEGSAGEARVTVSDTGSGMSSETVARAFEPFFTTKPVGLGTGLGLSTVRRIAAELGGSVTLESQLGLGTTVTLLLPLVVQPTQATPEVLPPRTAPSGRGHILVVDDEPALLQVLTRQLVAAGCQVTTAGDGELALALLQEDRTIDLVLTDMVMPRMGGEELARHVANEFPAVKVLCMSGTPGVTTRGVEAWAGDRVIPKPLELEMVTARIRQELGEPSHSG